MKAVLVIGLFSVLALPSFASSKVTCSGQGLSFDLVTDSAAKFENIKAKNPIVQKNLVEASSRGLTGPDQDGFDPGAQLYQGQFTSPHPNGIGAISLSIKLNGLAQLQWDDDDAGMLTVELKCR